MTIFMRMNITKRVRPASFGLMLGAAAGFTLAELGLGDVIDGVGTTSLVALSSAAGALIGGLEKSRILVVIDGFLLTIYFLVAWTPFAAAISNRWVRADPVPTRIDAVVVLSSGILSNGAMEVHGVDRLLTGIELLNRQLAPRLVTTRVGHRYRQGMVTSDDEQRRFIAFAAPSPLWDVVDSVYSTRDEATGTAKLLLPQNARRIAVVTSPMHTRRACATFEKLGFVVTCIPAREHAAVTIAPQTAHDRLATLREYLYELLGTVKYRSKGWMQ